MGLHDEIPNFSKRREMEVVAKKQDTYDEYDEECKNDSEYASFDFKMYKLDELGKFNIEVKELEALISPWWKNLKSIFSKSTFGKIGLIVYKKKSLLADDTFESVSITNVEESLDELKIFGQMLEKSYRRRFKSNMYGLVFYVLLAYWTGWNMIWYFLIGWALYDMFKYYFKYRKEKVWLSKAEKFIVNQKEHEVSVDLEKPTENNLLDIMAFNEAISKQEKEHWSIKIYDAVENLFTRKK